MRKLAGLCAIFLALSAGAFCKSPPQEPEKKTDQCGQCLDLPTGEVCTETGTLKNNCMAICRGVKIECNRACPCPPQK